MAQSQHKAGEESEYEYEYDRNETETFLIDLDLSSLNGITKLGSSAHRKRIDLTAKPKPRRKGKPKPKQPELNEGDEDGLNGNDDDDADEDGDVENGNENETEENQLNENAEDEGSGPRDQSGGSPLPGGPSNPDDDDEEEEGNSIQLLALASGNPMVLYDDKVYSCTWTDMIGTTLFFTQPGEIPLHESLRTAPGYDLLGTSRIKLVGHRTKMTAKRSWKPNVPSTPDEKRSAAVDEGQNGNSNRTTQPDPCTDERETYTSMIPAGRSLGAFTRTNPKTNADIRKQATFLEKMMDLKRKRGDKDIVRTFVNRNTLAAEQRKRLEMGKRAEKRRRKEELEKEKRTKDDSLEEQEDEMDVDGLHENEGRGVLDRRNGKGKEKEKEKVSETSGTSQDAEIERLNRLVVKGDAHALEKLQAIYSRLDDPAEQWSHEV